MESKSTLRRCLISNISKEATEAILQLVQVLCPLYISFDAKEQEIQFSTLLIGILRKLSLLNNTKNLILEFLCLKLLRIDLKLSITTKKTICQKKLYTMGYK